MKTTGTVGGVTPKTHAQAVKTQREMDRLMAKVLPKRPEVVRWKKQNN